MFWIVCNHPKVRSCTRIRDNSILVIQNLTKLIIFCTAMLQNFVFCTLYIYVSSQILFALMSEHAWLAWNTSSYHPEPNLFSSWGHESKFFRNFRIFYTLVWYKICQWWIYWHFLVKSGRLACSESFATIQKCVAVPEFEITPFSWYRIWQN